MKRTRIPAVFLILIVLLIGVIGVMLFNRERPRFVPGGDSAWFFAPPFYGISQPKLVAKFKARLAEVPGDPVALSRLAGMLEKAIFRGVSPLRFVSSIVSGIDNPPPGLLPGKWQVRELVLDCLMQGAANSINKKTQQEIIET